MQAREMMSALLDGETAEPTGAGLSTHMRTCAGCRRFLEGARALGTITHDAAAHTAPPDDHDVTTTVLDAARAAPRPRDPWTTSLRLGLVAVGIAQLALAVPGLLFGTDDGAPIHIAHEVGAWDLALAVGFVFAAWRPLRAVGLLPFAAALSAGLILTAVIDVAHGRAVALTETTHLLELVGTTLLYLLMTPRTRPRTALRVV